MTPLWNSERALAIYHPTRLRVALVGDSFINNLIGPVQSMVAKVSQIAGYGLGWLSAVVSDGGVISDNGAGWINGYSFVLPPGGIVRFALYSIAEVHGDSWRVFVLRGTGTFDVELKTVSGEWEKQGDTRNALTNVVSGTMPQGAYQLRVVCVSGTVDVIGCELTSTGSSGVVLCDFSRGGWHTPDITVAASILVPVVEAVAPDLILVGFADDRPTLSRYLPRLIEKLRAAHEETDFLLVAGSPRRGEDTAGSEARDWLAGYAANHDCSFFDGFYLFQSADFATAHGMLGTDGVHRTAGGDRLLVNRIFTESGLVFP